MNKTAWLIRFTSVGTSTECTVIVHAEDTKEALQELNTQHPRWRRVIRIEKGTWQMSECVYAYLKDNIQKLEESQ